jgi:hypothetical protein
MAPFVHSRQAQRLLALLSASAGTVCKGPADLAVWIGHHWRDNSAAGDPQPQSIIERRGGTCQQALVVRIRIWVGGGGDGAFRGSRFSRV